jgi:uncharacterized cupredoxin-like copper-binding protein
MARRARAVMACLTLAAALAAWSAGAAGPAVGEPGEVRTVVLDIRWSTFSESTITVRRGTTVRFVLRNYDPIPHELIVGDQEVQDRHEYGTEAHHGEVPGEVSVAQNGTAETTYTFTTRGRLLFGCHLPGHWDYGMRGVIRVV